MAVRSQVEVFDEGGILLCTNRCTTLFPTLGDMGAGRCPGGTAPFRTARRTWWSGTTLERRRICSIA